MLRYIWCGLLPIIALVIVSCDFRGQGEGKGLGPEQSDADSLILDTISAQEEYLEEGEELGMVDEFFDDFLFSFCRSHSIQKERIVFPLTELMLDGSHRELQRNDWYDDFHFLQQDYYTTLYTSASEMSLPSDTTMTNVCVERIDLQKRTVRSYDFRKDSGRWQLHGIRNMHLEDTDLEDFCSFYSRFSTDSLFQMECVARRVRVTMPDEEDASQTMDGIIDREQWPMFRPVMPVGEMSNIRYTQNYQNARRITLMKSGGGSGLQESVTFELDNHGWKLTAYEN